MDRRKISANILIVAGLTVAIIGGAAFLRQESDYAASEAEYQRAQDMFLRSAHEPEGEDPGEADTSEPAFTYVEPAEITPPSGKSGDHQERKKGNEVKIPKAPDVDWKELTRVNDEIVGWITVPAIDISYPVLIGDDNEEYLHKTMYGSYLYAGSLFIDHDNSRDWSDMNTIIYGHNMNNGSMFGKLKQLREKKTYKRCPYIWVAAPDEDRLYRIVSVQTVNTSSDAYTLFKENDERVFADWYDEQTGRSEFECLLPDKHYSKCITLSTCTSARDDTRLIVQAVEVPLDTGE